jgi:hypothetical protein
MLLGNGSQQQTFLCFWVYVFAGRQPSLANLILSLQTADSLLNWKLELDLVI